MSLVKELVSFDDYLAMSFDGADPELIDGEIVERAMPGIPHARAQQGLAERFGSLRRIHGLAPFPELRLRVGPETVYVADYCVFRSPAPTDVPTTPPWIVVEIVSPGEAYSRLFRKLERYREWGVEHVWVIDPDQRRLNVYREEGLLRVAALELPEIGLSIGSEDLFEEPT